jgi:hypothetical protein
MPRLTRSTVLLSRSCSGGWADRTNGSGLKLQSMSQLGLLIQNEHPVYEVFVNGQKIGGSSNMATRQGPQYTGAILSFPSSLAHSGRVLIATRRQEFLRHVTLPALQLFCDNAEHVPSCCG